MDSSCPSTPHRLEYRLYNRPFSRPLVTSRGSWSVRSGLVLKVENEETGMRQFGEVAPLPDFGSESLPEAQYFLDTMTGKRTAGELQTAIRQAPSATSFGIWTATSDSVNSVSSPSSALISLGDSSPGKINKLTAGGYVSFKLKLGSKEPAQEWESLQAVVGSLSPGQSLRLDPNRSWNHTMWEFWKPRLAEVSEWIQFLEEPFAPSTSWDSWLREAANSPVSLALDESLSPANLTNWCDLNWPGYWIIKPSIMGPPPKWLSLLDKHKDRVILSSAFETGIGLSSLVDLSKSFPECIHGLGTQDFFDDLLGTRESGATVKSLSAKEQEEIWNRLSVA